MILLRLNTKEMGVFKGRRVKLRGGGKEGKKNVNVWNSTWLQDLAENRKQRKAAVEA